MHFVQKINFFIFSDFGLAVAIKLPSVIGRVSILIFINDKKTKHFPRMLMNMY